MSFSREKIDRAIVLTQYDLRGFRTLGIRLEKNTPKTLDAITCNLAAFSAGLYDVESIEESYADYFTSSYEDYLAMCRRLAEACDFSEKEAIQLIIQEIVDQSEEMKAEVAAGRKSPSAYLRPLERSNRWGKAIIALAEAFEIKIEQTAAKPT